MENVCVFVSSIVSRWAAHERRGVFVGGTRKEACVCGRDKKGCVCLGAEQEMRRVFGGGS